MDSAAKIVDEALGILTPAEKTADDWVTAFAKKSNEALAKKAAEKKAAPPPDEGALVSVLARKGHTEYDRLRSDVAETLGIRVGTLDDKVEAIRKKIEDAEENGALPHWHVEPWSEEVDGDALLDSLRRVFRRYIVLPSGADIALPLWVLHAWTMDAGDISPFMVLVSPTKRCGKTSVLILLYFLTPKSELASNITASALFRYIEAVRPTLLLDEGDTFVKDNEEFRGILDSGHTRVAANIVRNVEVNGEHKPRRFSTWAPKAIATIRKIADTLEDRAVIVTLQRKARTAKVERLRRRDSEEFANLRRQAARWAADNFAKLADPDPQVPEVLNDRAADNWRPLLAIADLAGGEWPQRARDAACLLSGEGHDGAIGVELLKDIQIAFGDDEAIRSKDLIAKLIEDPERPWAEWSHNRALTPKQLGRLLQPFGICSETVYIPGLANGKGYQRAHFEELWAAYCPVKTPSAADPLPVSRGSGRVPVASAQVDDFRNGREGISPGSKDGNLAYSHADSPVCTANGAGGDGEDHSDQGIVPLDDGIPDGLRRTGHRCNHCGSQFGTMSRWDWAGRPDGIWLHERCEGPWHDSAGRRQ
jgi:putative DNA primase/helicase